MTAIRDHDSYIAAAPEPFRASLKQLRALLASALPEAKEVVAYNMPGFSVGGSIIASYAAFSKQCGLYVRPHALAAHADEVAALGLKATKTGVTFTPRKPIPDELVLRLANTSREDAPA